MTQIDITTIVLIVCMTNLGVEFIKLNQLKESTKAALIVRQLQTRYDLSK